RENARVNSLPATISGASRIARSPFDFLEQPRRGSSDFAFLLELFPARLDHLIVGSFLAAVANEMFTERFVIVIDAGARDAMAAVVRSDFPFFCHLRVVGRFLGWLVVFNPHQFCSR